MSAKPYWVFHEGQLTTARELYQAELIERGWSEDEAQVMSNIVRDFLYSDSVLGQKMAFNTKPKKESNNE